jgi:hypothetical protein
VEKCILGLCFFDVKYYGWGIDKSGIILYNLTVKKIHIDLENKTHEILLKLKAKENRSLQFLVNRAIMNYLTSKKILLGNENKKQN